MCGLSVRDLNHVPRNNPSLQHKPTPYEHTYMHCFLGSAAGAAALNWCARIDVVQIFDSFCESFGHYAGSDFIALLSQDPS